MRISDWSSDVCSSDLRYRACPSRTDRPGRTDHPLERPPANGLLQNGAGARGRLHGGSQTSRGRMPVGHGLNCVYTGPGSARRDSRRLGLDRNSVVSGTKVYEGVDLVGFWYINNTKNI